MIRRLSVGIPPSSAGLAPVAGDGAPRAIRILAVSDEPDSVLGHGLDRASLGPVDLLVSCGDLPPDYLSYLEGTLRVRFVYVTGNHDLDEAWRREAEQLLPARPARAELIDVGGFAVARLDWPGGKQRTREQAFTAWRDAAGLWLTVSLRRRRPLIVASHVAPHDAGDTPDHYHRGFRAYRWLAERLEPALWLHGHTTPASVPQRVTHIGATTCVNVTGAYLIELVAGAETGGGARS